MKGKVYLVGAGPGDPELLTLKALRTLKQADTVLHDDLVPEEILRLVPAGVQRHNVGKRSGTKTITQQEINFLMVSLAGLGLQVVRLKSGDPLIFGRAGEEMAALRRAGIEYEIVPGVTSGFGAAAQAGIPLTHRGEASAVVLLTAHQAGDEEERDWCPLIASGVTLVVYMPGADYSLIAAKLLGGGITGATPCAIVSRATRPEQQVELTTVANLASAAALPAPALLVVGSVVNRAQLSASANVDGSESLFPVPSLTALLSRASDRVHEKEIA